MSKTSLSVVILAAGKGTRMHSTQLKVLHTLAGIPLIQHVINTALKLGTEQLHIVYGYGGEQLKEKIVVSNLNWILQAEQLGTGHALQQVVPHFKERENVLVLYGDVPLISADTLKKLIKNQPPKGIALVTVTLDDPNGYGRILRKQGNIVGIVEQKDASAEQLNICEVNTGILIVNAKDLTRWLAKLTNHNHQQEFYLTDIIAFAHQEGKSIQAVQPQHAFEVAGINNRLQLAALERTYQRQQAEKLLLAGVTLMDPQRFDLRGELIHGKDVVVDTNVIIEGQVILGDRVKIGTGCILKNCTIGDGSTIKPYSVLTDATIEAACSVGPFAHLRPGAYLSTQAQVGNFVEMKQASLGKGSKAGHLSYLGDATIGAEVNIGAGTITCNYDGANKHQTIIEDHVFVGSDTQLIAPVTVKQGATIAAGTTVTDNVAENGLVLSRVKQVQIQGWQRPKKNHK